MLRPWDGKYKDTRDIKWKVEEEGGDSSCGGEKEVNTEGQTTPRLFGNTSRNHVILYLPKIIITKVIILKDIKSLGLTKLPTRTTD